MWNYRNRIERDLVRWRQQGWVTPAGEAAIRRDVAGGQRTLGLANSLSVLSVILIGFAVMSFVGANWQEMPRVVRLSLLLAALWASYAFGGLLARRGMGGFANSAILLAVCVYGASVMLIAQMYHIDGNPPDGVLAWFAGALLTGVVLRSNPALALAMALAALWGTMETLSRNEVFWPFLMSWALVSAAFYWRRWRPGLHLSGLALTGFVVSLGYVLPGGHAHGLVVAIGLAVAGASFFGGQTRPDLSALSPIIANYGFVITFAGLFALQFIEQPGLDVFILLAGLALVITLAAVYWGLEHHNRGALWLGYIGFSIEILAIYAKTVGTIANTALFFLVAGLIVSGLAALAHRLHKQSENAESPS